MKKSAILLIGIIAVAIGVIISTYADSSTYGSFNDAKDSAAELHVVGRLDLAKDMVYNPKKDANYFSFYVKDYQPEAGSALDSAPDFEETLVKNIDEVLGGSSQLEKYATKSKTARYTKGDAIADEMEGRAQSELDRMKDEGLFDD